MHRFIGSVARKRHRRRQVGAQQLDDRIIVEFGQRPPVAGADIVDQNIETAMVLVDIGHRSTLCLAIGDVECGDLRRAARGPDGRYGVFQRRRRTSVDDDMRAGFGKGARHLEAQTTATAGHQRHLPCQRKSVQYAHGFRRSQPGPPRQLMDSVN